MRILGLDVGEKRIGVAKVDSKTRIAVPIGFLVADGSEWQEIAKIARLNNTNLFVLGLPRNNEGAETAQSLYVRNFAKTLIEKIPEAKIRFQDESLTSVEAEERLKSRSKTYQKGDIDAEAAAIILEDFIENFNTTGQKPPEETTRIEKEAEKVKLNTKKAKHKMKTTTKWITGIIILAILGLAGTGAALYIRDARHKNYAEYFAQLEAEMQPDVFNFTILPGETIFDVQKNLIEAGYSEAEVKEALAATYDFAMLKERPEGASLEGYLHTETHEFYKEVTAKELINTFLEGTQKMINDNNLEARFEKQGLTLYEGITLASIVQKEAKTPDQPTVAQVFLRRLASGMLLGSDVTVSYALDVVDPDRQTYTDNRAALAVESCYNTRRQGGLPCGPISNPGLSALLAVANPSDTTYLYFLTGDDGLMYYGYTEAEHIQNIQNHCQDLCNVAL